MISPLQSIQVQVGEVEGEGGEGRSEIGYEAGSIVLPVGEG